MLEAPVRFQEEIQVNQQTPRLRQLRHEEILAILLYVRSLQNGRGRT